MKKSIVYSIIITLAMIAQSGAHSILRDASTLDRGQVANFLLQNTSITKQGNTLIISTIAAGWQVHDGIIFSVSEATDTLRQLFVFSTGSIMTGNLQFTSGDKINFDDGSGNGWLMERLSGAQFKLSRDGAGTGNFLFGTSGIGIWDGGGDADVKGNWILEADPSSAVGILKLSIAGTERFVLTAGSMAIYTTGNNIVGDGNASSKWDVFDGSITIRGTNAGLRIGDSVFLVETGGNVGIGTTDASSIFDVFNGSITVRGTDSGLRVEGISRFQSEVVFSSQVNIILGSSNNVTIDGETNARSIRRGVVRINHKPGTEGTRALFINTDRHAQGNTHSLHIDYHADGMTAGAEEEVAEFVVISSNATGGEINALEVNKIGTGTVKVNAVSAGIDVHVITQKSGAFSGVDGGFTYDGATYITAVSSFNVDNSTGNIDLWSSNDDYVVWGSSSLFDESEFLFSSFATKDLNLIFQFSTGTHLGEDIEEGGWVTFPSINSTIEGGQSAGLVSWDRVALVELGWATTTVQGVHDIYWIRAQRNKTGGVGTITERIIQVDSGDVLYGWDKHGNLIISTASMSNLVVTGTKATFRNVEYTMPADDGESDEFLQTDGSGILDWAAAAAGGGVTLPLPNNDTGYFQLNSSPTVTGAPNFISSTTFVSTATFFTSAATETAIVIFEPPGSGSEHWRMGVDPVGNLLQHCSLTGKRW